MTTTSVTKSIPPVITPAIVPVLFSGFLLRSPVIIYKNIHKYNYYIVESKILKIHSKIFSMSSLVN